MDPDEDPVEQHIQRVLHDDIIIRDYIEYLKKEIDRLTDLLIECNCFDEIRF